MRTIQELRKNCYGKLHVFCKDEATARKFLEEAEREGFMFGEYKPTTRSISSLYAVETENSLAHVGAIGRMAFQSGAAIRVDYSKYINGEDEYIIYRI